MCVELQTRSGVMNRGQSSGINEHKQELWFVIRDIIIC